MLLSNVFSFAGVSGVAWFFWSAPSGSLALRYQNKMKSFIKVVIIALLFPIWGSLIFSILYDVNFLYKLREAYFPLIVPGIIIAIVLVRIERAKIFITRRYSLSAFLYLIASSFVGLLGGLIFIFIAVLVTGDVRIGLGQALHIFMFFMIAGFLCGISSLIIPPKKFW